MTAPVEPGAAVDAGDAAAAAIAELEKLDQSSQAAMDPQRYVPGGPPPARQYAAPLSPQQAAGYAAASGYAQDDFPPMPMGRTPVTLEDLYAFYPGVGDGTYKLRVIRVQPKHWRGSSVAGFLGDVDEKLSMAEFTDRFGGGTYRVYVLGPMRNKFDDNGAPLIRQLPHNVEVTIPGPPSLNSLPMHEEDMMFQGPGRHASYNPVFRSGEDSNVQIKRMEIEQKERERVAREQSQLYQQAFAPRPGVGSEAVGVLADQSMRAVGEVRSAHELHMQTLREQNQALMSSIKEKDDENRGLRNEVTKLASEAAKSELLRSELSETRAKLSAELDHARQNAARELDNARQLATRELDARTTRHAEELRELRDRHEAQIRETNDRQRDEVSRLSSRYTEERQLLNEQTNEKLRAAREEHDRRERDIRDSHLRELNTLKEAQERELRVIRESGDSRMKMVETSTTVEMRSAQDQLVRAREENVRLARENDDLRMKINKTPVEAIREAKELASLVGMTEGGADSDGEEKWTWQREATGMIKTALERAPDMLRELGAMRQGGAAAQQQQAAAMQQQAMLEQQQQQQFAQPPQLMSAQQQQQQAEASRRRQAAQQRQQWQPGMPPPGFGRAPTPPPMRGSAVPAAAPLGPTPPAWNSVHPAGPPPPIPPARPAVPLAEDPPAKQPLAPATPIAGPAAASPPSGSEAQVAQALAGEPAQGEPATMSMPPPLDITDEQLGEFITRLEQAIRSDMVPARMFAEGFIKEVGIDRTRRLLQLVQPAQIVQIVQSALDAGAARGLKPQESKIVTYEGQKYLGEVWGEAAKLVG